MKNWIKKKEFETIFAPFNENGTQIWVITGVKKLPSEIVKMAISVKKSRVTNLILICRFSFVENANRVFEYATLSG